MSTARGSGRTYRMVMMIPDSGGIVVVPHQGLELYVRQMITDIRGFVIASKCKVIKVQTDEDLHMLRSHSMGADRPIFLDHCCTDGSAVLTPDQPRLFQLAGHIARFANRRFNDAKETAL